MKRSRFTFIDLFSGIGGFHLGLSRSGGKCVLASEIVGVSSETYYTNYGLRPHGDVRLLKIGDIPIHDVLCAGFPCQSFSNIGPKTGLDDDRGELIYEVFRILTGRRPKSFILENVKGLVSINNGKVLSYILETLCNIGYDVSCRVLEAKDYGLPQLRKRLFIVGIRKDLGVEFSFPDPIPLKYTLQEVLGGTVNRSFGYTVRIGGRRSGIDSRYNWDAYIVNGKERIITPEECLLLQGFPKKFILIGNESQKYFQVGNSVPVSIVEAIGKKFVELAIF